MFKNKGKCLESKRKKVTALGIQDKGGHPKEIFLRIKEK